MGRLSDLYYFFYEKMVVGLIMVAVFIVLLFNKLFPRQEVNTPSNNRG